MMLDKDLFFTLCEKYNVELSESAKAPMIQDRTGVHTITTEDIHRVFASCQTSFGYSGDKLNTTVNAKAYYLQDNFAIAC
ncbi:MAG: hypothetical protein NC318_06085 [Blautia sp.]|nr:hypothetical protein [Lachnoclostridium sp.]MCM1211154.1 hypothetical protein [Blautia sp.]